MLALLKLFRNYKQYSTVVNEENEITAKKKNEEQLHPTIPWLKYHALILPPQEAKLLSADGTKIIHDVTFPVSLPFHCAENFQTEHDKRSYVGVVKNKFSAESPSRANITETPLEYSFERQILRTGQNNDLRLTTSFISSFQQRKPPPIYLIPRVLSCQKKIAQNLMQTSNCSNNFLISNTQFDTIRNNSSNMTLTDCSVGDSKINIATSEEYLCLENMKKIAGLTNLDSNNLVSLYSQWNNSQNITNKIDANYNTPYGLLFVCDEQKPESNENTTAELLGLEKIVQLSNKLQAEIVHLQQRKAEIKIDYDIGGLGMFATEDINPGEIVFVDKPFLECKMQYESMWEAFMKLSNDDIKKLNSISTHESESTYGETCTCWLTCLKADHKEKYESFKRFVNIMICNAHGCLESAEKLILFFEGLRANHSCTPNVSYRNVEGHLCYVATRKIKKGESINMTYINELYSSTTHRQKKLLRDKCFLCLCQKCSTNRDISRCILCPKCQPRKSNIIEYKRMGVRTVNDIKNKNMCVDAKQLNGDSTSLIPLKEKHEAFSSSTKSFEAILDYAASAEDDTDSFIWSSDGEIETDKKINNITVSDYRLVCEDINKNEKAESENKKNSDQRKSQILILEEETCVSSLLGNTSSDTHAETSDEENSVEEITTKNKIDSVESYNKNLLSSKLFTSSKGYCYLEEKNLWVCHTCKSSFTDEYLPLQLENDLIKEWESLSSLIDKQNCEDFQQQCEKLLTCVEQELGTEHWLFAGIHFLLFKVYSGLYCGGIVLEDNFDHALQHSEIFLSYIKRKAPEAMYIEGVLCVSAIMRLALFNGRWIIFKELAEKGYLEDIRVSYGYWDETYLSYKEAYDYICHTTSPKLLTLHQLAHSSQRIAMKIFNDLQIKTEKENNIKEETKESKDNLKERFSASRDKQIVTSNLNKNRNTNLYEQNLNRKPQDVTRWHPNSIVNKFMFGDLKYPRGIIQDALKVAHRNYVEENQKTKKQFMSHMLQFQHQNILHGCIEKNKSKTDTGQCVNINQWNNTKKGMPLFRFFVSLFHIDKDTKQCQHDNIGTLKNCDKDHLGKKVNTLKLSDSISSGTIPMLNLLHQPPNVGILKLEKRKNFSKKNTDKNFILTEIDKLNTSYKDSNTICTNQNKKHFEHPSKFFWHPTINNVDESIKIYKTPKQTKEGFRKLSPIPKIYCNRKMISQHSRYKNAITNQQTLRNF